MIDISKNKWTNNKLDIFWLKKIFNRYIAAYIVKRYQLSILDSYSSYVTAEINHFYKKH